MKKVFAAVAAFVLALGADAQTSMRITMEDGKQIDYPVSSIANVTWITNDENPDTPGVSPSDVQAVDLGLPSGLKWANMNVGATTPEDYGDYFAWGETEPKSTYNWSTYKWCNGSYKTMTKYCADSDYGSIDYKTDLQYGDDAAHVNWGGYWRMPTNDEQDELAIKCTWTWTTQNGVKGYKVTSKSNGNSIFLPAAGYYDESGLRKAGEYGKYWSRSLYKISSYNGYGLDFNWVDSYWGIYDRCYGLSVRAVCW